MNNNKTNQATEKNHKFNVVDVVVLFIVFSVACVAFLWIDPFDWIKAEPKMQEKTVLYVVELKDIEKSKSETIKTDDDVIFVTSGIDIGRVVGINKTYSSEWNIPESGDKMILYIHPTLDTVFVTIEIDCFYQEGKGYFLHGQQLLVGRSIHLKFPMFEVSGECVSIRTKE